MQVEQTVPTAGGTLFLRLIGKLDLDSHTSIKSSLSGACNTAPRCVVLNLSRVEQLSSCVVGLFIRFARELEDVGAKLVLAEPSRATTETLRLLQLQNAFIVYSDEAAAAEAASRGTLLPSRLPPVVPTAQHKHS